MKKVDWEAVRDFAGNVCEFASFVALVVASRKAIEYVTEESNSTIARYDDAVGAIVKSDMYSHDQRTAIAALKTDGDSEFYKSIIHIVKNSNMYSHDKLGMIKELSQK